MINTQLKFEAKIPNGSKVCRIHNVSHKTLKLQDQFDLVVQGSPDFKAIQDI